MDERKTETGQDKNELESEQRLVDVAVDVVDMFDQANTDHAIESLGSRGALLKGAISKLRRSLNSGQKRTTLDSRQVGE